jgi:hypothetical protein
VNDSLILWLGGEADGCKFQVICRKGGWLSERVRSVEVLRCRAVWFRISVCERVCLARSSAVIKDA